ncbi:MAG: hypothetical protein A2Y25_09125 [Candidatus Melainabacteria bacterium GWF2_37_15]|nr:MAG: hypothetical protein A2Y25_09125 [Candidatus Melainabacteria bacterium GWF2_37_15]
MKFNYYPDTDSLYIDLTERKSVESIEISPGVVVDYDENGNIVGIDIDKASKKVNISKLETHSLPLDNISMIA